MSRYRVRVPFGTRWNDNDQYGHLNNTVYYEAMDTAVNAWMIRSGHLDPLGGEPIALCAASACEFHAPTGFPAALEVGIAVERLGTTSITWDLAILVAGEEGPVATGRFTHVFVDAASRRPTAIPAAVRESVERDLSITAATR